MRTREQHLAWCKQDASSYLDRGDLSNAVAAMLSDLAKHPETAGVGEQLSALGIMYAMQGDEPGVRRFIEGFN